MLVNICVCFLAERFLFHTLKYYSNLFWLCRKLELKKMFLEAPNLCGREWKLYMYSEALCHLDHAVSEIYLPVSLGSHMDVYRTFGASVSLRRNIFFFTKKNPEWGGVGFGMLTLLAFASIMSHCIRRYRNTQ